MNGSIPTDFSVRRHTGPGDNGSVGRRDRARRRRGAFPPSSLPPLRSTSRARDTTGIGDFVTVLDLDRIALNLRSALDHVAVPLSRAAVALLRSDAWTLHGYARLADYARERLGRSDRWVRELACLGYGLDALPALHDALTGDDGGRPLGRALATRVARVAGPDSVAAWIVEARRSTVAEFRKAMRTVTANGESVPSARTDTASSAHESGDVATRFPAPPARDEPPATPRGTGTSSDPALGPEPCPGLDPGPDPGPWSGPEQSAVSGDASDTMRRRVRIPVPGAVRIAFDEALALARATSGHDLTVTAFVECLVAEAFAGPAPPDVDCSPLGSGPPRADVEALLARTTGRWAALDERGETAELADHVQALLDRLRFVARRAGLGGAVEVDVQMRELIGLEDELQRQLGPVLEAMRQRGAWATLLFNGVGHYAEERLGMCRRGAEQRARLARLLLRFPVLREAYEAGSVGCEAALEVLRVLGSAPVDRSIERAWVDRARTCTIKRLRAEVRAISRRRLVGDDDGQPPMPLDDGEWQRSLAQHPGTICDRVTRLGLDAARLPDADVFLDLRLPDGLANDFLAAIEARRREIATRVDAVPWDRPLPDDEASPAALAARLFCVRARRLPAWIGLLGLIEDFVATWDDVRGFARRRSSDIYSRDGWCCTAPGCSSRRHLEAHHLQYRSHGGDDSPENRTCLCRFHHRLGEHGHLAACGGIAPLDITWRLGREDVAEWFRNEIRLRGQA